MDRELINYIQNRVVGKIYDVVYYPPSLLLRDATIFMVRLDYNQDSSQKIASILSSEKRKKYGLVFSQITYYEPIEKIKLFLTKDYRVSKEEN